MTLPHYSAMMQAQNDDRDFRVDIFRDGSVSWRGAGRVIHKQSGLSVEFEIAWNDRSGIERAKAQLRQRLKQDDK